jgi:hypothetical protein
MRSTEAKVTMQLNAFSRLCASSVTRSSNATSINANPRKTHSYTVGPKKPFAPVLDYTAAELRSKGLKHIATVDGWLIYMDPSDDRTLVFVCKKVGERFAVYGDVYFDFEAGKQLGQKIATNYKNLAVPHIDFSKELAGKGLATFIYMKALQSGIVLITKGHAPAAKLLWDRLAKNKDVVSKNLKGARILMHKDYV